MAKAKKKENKKDEPVKVYGSFEEVIKVSITPTKQPTKKEAEKQVQKKK